MEVGMSGEIQGVRARCESCHRAYRVSRADRLYRCKACGGTVRAVAEEEAGDSALAGTLTCESCHAVNLHDARFCAECGAVLTGSGEPPHLGEEGLRARHEANLALKRGHVGIVAVAWLYRLGSLAYAVVTLFAVLALARREVPLREGVLVVGMTTMLACLLLAGAIQILFQPFLWALVIAVLSTAVTLVHLFGPNPLGLALPCSAAWTVLAWAAVAPTWRFRRLMREHLDLYILHHASVKTRRSLKGHSASERHERLVRVMHRAALRAWKLSAAVAVALVLASALGTRFVVTQQRPQELSDALASFTRAWNASDLDAVEAFFPAGVRDERSLWLERVVEGHGWKGRLPHLAASRPRPDGDEEDLVVEHELATGPVTARWILNGRRWSVDTIALPPPPLEPALERFRAAWSRSDAGTLAGFFGEDSRARMQASIERSARLRGWKPFPAIQRTEVEGVASGDAVATLELPEGTVTTKWYFGADGAWSLYGLQFPER